MRKAYAGTKGGFVFRSMEALQEPLLDYLAPLSERLDPFGCENMRYRWNLTLDNHCNWKIALGALMEGYHVTATHTRLLPHESEGYTQSYAHGRHTHFGLWQQGPGIDSPSPRLEAEAPTDHSVGLVANQSRLMVNSTSVTAKNTRDDHGWSTEVDLDVDGQAWKTNQPTSLRILPTAQTPNRPREALVCRVGESRKPTRRMAWGETVHGTQRIERHAPPYRAAT